ncbi:MAG: hypothetical protein AAGG48_27430 [Planctomycetota bacterium]
MRKQDSEQFHALVEPASFGTPASHNEKVWKVKDFTGKTAGAICAGVAVVGSVVLWVWSKSGDDET